MPKVSVIVPCYNVAPYVGACLDSLVNQTLHDIEIICVDDKSTDNTAEIVRERARTDSRIKLIELPKNGGVSVARNTGIDAAIGECIGFVDPDDYVDLDFYEKLYNKAQKTGAEVCVSNIKEHLLDGSICARNYLPRQVVKDKRFFNYTVWCAIYKTSFIKDNKIYCPTGITNGEDTVFCVKCSVLAKQMAGVSDTYYHYIRYANSAETKYYTPRQVESRIKMAHAIADFLNEIEVNKNEYSHHYSRAFWYVCYNVFEKTTLKELRMRSLENAMDLYRKCKHKSCFEKRATYPYLVCDDIEGLYEFINNLGKNVAEIKFTMFKCINIIRIKREQDRAKIYLFGVPLFYMFFHNK